MGKTKLKGWLPEEGRKISLLHTEEAVLDLSLEVLNATGLRSGGTSEKIARTRSRRTSGRARKSRITVVKTVVRQVMLPVPKVRTNAIPSRFNTRKPPAGGYWIPDVHTICVRTGSGLLPTTGLMVVPF